MPKYIVTVNRVSYQTLEIEVDAATQEEASEKARDTAPGLLFGSDRGSEYEVESVFEI